MEMDNNCNNNVIQLVEGPMHPRLIKLETIPCGKQHAVCEANVVLNESVEANRIYQLSLSVRDTSGGVTSVTSTIQVTNASVSLSSAFHRLNQYITLPEVNSFVHFQSRGFLSTNSSNRTLQWEPPSII